MTFTLEPTGEVLNRALKQLSMRDRELLRLFLDFCFSLKSEGIRRVFDLAPVYIIISCIELDNMDFIYTVYETQHTLYVQRTVI